MITLIAIIFFVLIICKWKYMIPVFMTVSLWINPDVRVLGVTIINVFAFYIIIRGFVKLKANKTILDRYIYIYIVYTFFINIPFILLSTGGNMVDQLYSMKGKIPLLVGYIIWNQPLKLRNITKTHKFIYISIALVCFYGIFSYLTKTNYLLDYLQPFMTTADFAAESAEKTMHEERGALIGRITGTAIYTIQYGILLVIFFYYYLSYSFLTKKNEYLPTFFLLLLIFINIYLTGSRGPLAALFIGLFILIMGNFTLKQKILLIISCAVIFLILNDQVNNFILLFSSDSINGSSVEGREGQLIGALSLVSDSLQSLLFGKGINYTSYYIEKFGPHPLAFCFESSHISGLVNTGLLGLIFVFLANYLILYYIAYTAYKLESINRKNFYFLLAYLVTGFCYAILVGSVYNNLYIATFFIQLKMFTLYSQQLNK